MSNRPISEIKWYDSESSGVNLDFDQIYQAAIVSTDLNLNLIKGGEKEFICKPRIDINPHPMAFLTHKLDIDMLKEKGMTEFELAQKISNEFLSGPSNVIAGYNTVSFDDELVRRLLFRNMLDPYTHEWRDGNFRFDAFKMVQVVYALRPEMLTWRKNSEGKDSLKLEHLVADNNLGSHKAHDAVGDCYATINLVRHLKDQNPKLFQHMLRLTDKKEVNKILFNEPKIENRRPVINISTIYGNGKKYGSVALPIISDLSNQNKALCIDLTQDPSELFAMSAPDINKFLFTKRELLAADDPRVPAIGIASNKLPALLEMRPNTLSDNVAMRMDIDLDKVEENRLKIINHIQKDKGFVKRLQAGFSSDHAPKKDAFETIYAQFLTDKDKNVRAILTQKMNVTDVSPFKIEHSDIYAEATKTDDKARQKELMLRAKWTNFGLKMVRSLAKGETKAEQFKFNEYKEWVDYLNKALVSGELGLSFKEFESEIVKVRTERALTVEEDEILVKLEKHVADIQNAFVKLSDNTDAMSENIEIEKHNNRNIQRFMKIFNRTEDELTY